MKLRLEKLACLGLLVASMVALGACASGPDREQQSLRKAETQKGTPTVEKPPPEELAKSPCGNPDWAQLPPNTQGADATDEDAPGDNAPADGAEDDEREDARLHPDRQPPCT